MGCDTSDETALTVQTGLMTVWHGRSLHGCNPGWQADADADLANIPKVPDGKRDLISDENVSRLHRAVRLILPTNSSPNRGRGLVYLAHVEHSLVYIYWPSFVCADSNPGGCILQVAATLFPTTLGCDSEYLRTFIEYRQLVETTKTRLPCHG